MEPPRRVPVAAKGFGEGVLLVHLRPTDPPRHLDMVW